MKNLPYVGVTGVSSVQDAEMVLNFFPPRSWARRVMVGILVSGHRTLRGEPGSSPRYPATPVAREIAAHVRATRLDVFPVVHFNTKTTHVPLDVELADLVRAVPDLGGIQLNLHAPDPVALRRFREERPHLEIILQVSFDKIFQGTPREDLRRYVESYVGLVDHALLDASRGRGEELPVETCAAALRSFGSHWLAQGIRVGVAGGLGPDAGPTLLRLADQSGPIFGSCSFDAESRLRDTSDRLNAGRLSGYAAVLLTALHGKQVQEGHA